MCTLTVIACDPEPILLSDSQIISDGSHTGIFVLSEGLINQNNSTLAWVDFSTGQPDSWKTGSGRSYDCFEKVNARRIGDTANDLLLYGGRLYIAVSESSTIEIIDAATCSSLSQIKLQTGGVPSQPRRLTAHDGYVYVCCFDGTLQRIDTLTLKADASLRVGRNPDGICYSGGKLYISNSGGLDYTDPDSTVSVIDLNTFTEIQRINVRPNPGNIYADGNDIYVVSRGIFDYGTMDYDSRLHRIDGATGSVTATFDIPILNMDITDGKAYFYGYGAGGTIQVLDLATGEITNREFITDGTVIQCPYSIRINPESGKLYVCDALDYVTPGSLMCFSPEGRLLYRVQNIGINPNTIQFCDINVTTKKYDGPVESRCDIDTVFEYMPAPGQFVNTMPSYRDGDDAATMAGKCLTALQTGQMINLGAFGGYMTARFKTTVMNLDGADFRIDGNAIGNGAEPGVVWVSADVNGNGLPDDTWYEIYGSEHHQGHVRSAYTICYRKPQQDDGDILWSASDGETGSLTHNTFHSQSYWPMWYDADSVTFTATLLPPNMSKEGTQWVMPAYDYGYVDNQPNSDTNSSFDIEWAVKADGTPAGLTSIDFVRIQVGVIGCNSLTGEQSTEITAIYNLNP